MRRSLTALFSLALLAAACGDDSGDTAATTPDPTTTSAPDPTTTMPSGPTTEPGTATTTEPGTATTDGGTDGELPGERMEIYPYEGATVAVVGVAADDTLNVRAAPGTEAEIRFGLAPLEDDVTATGHNRMLEESGLWAEVEAADGTGWVNARYLAQLGQVNDITSEIAPTPADRPTAETMLELGQLIAQGRASQEPPSEIVVVDGPSVGDLGEVTVDVVGLGDDSVHGERLHVFGEPDPGGEGFTLRTVEATTLCARGVTDDRLCV